MEDIERFCANCGHIVGPDIEIIAERDRLREINKELVGALKYLSHFEPFTQIPRSEEIVKEVIDKSEKTT